jgi:hypothetical protein
MPKLPCRCGYVHNLSPIPDDGFQVLPDWATDRLLYTQDTQPEKWEIDELRQTALSRLYSCPNCEAVMWESAGDGYYKTYVRCERMIRIFADIDDRDAEGGILLRHPRTLADIERERLLLRHGSYVVVHDDRAEVYVFLEEPEEGTAGDQPWVGRPLADDEAARVRALEE